MSKTIETYLKKVNDINAAKEKAEQDLGGEAAKGGLMFWSKDDREKLFKLTKSVDAEKASEFLANLERNNK